MGPNPDNTIVGPLSATFKPMTVDSGGSITLIAQSRQPSDVDSAGGDDA